MGTNEGFDKDPLSCGSFSHMLNSGDVVGLEMTESFIFPPSFSSGNTPTTLCFGNDCGEDERGFGKTGVVNQKSGITGYDSSSASSSNNSNSVTKLKRAQSGEKNTDYKIRNCLEPESVSRPGSGVSVESQKSCKKPKAENSTSTGPSKVRKEKLGERITALQQLVSPFGKTDTASVLHEAMGYIRFLHDQVQVLSSPYLQRLPSSAIHLVKDERGVLDVDDDETKYNLRSRGLCLVPVACTVQMAKSNGADFWSPAMGSSSTKY